MKRHSPHIIFFILLFFCFYLSHGQCLPASRESFFSKLKFNNSLPERILNGRSVVFYEKAVLKPELEKIQASFASGGIDGIVAIELEKLLAGHDVAKVIFNALQKREVSNLIFFLKNEKGYECVITKFNNKFTFISKSQNAWRKNVGSLNELLFQLNKEALSQYKKQNLLISEQPELDFPIKLFTGSRMESFTGDLRIDRMAVRMSDREEENNRLKEACKQYPYKIEFVADSISDAELRQKGFWYVLACVREQEKSVRDLLGYSIENASKNQNENVEPIFKFYIKKLEYDHVYLGKQWDASISWESALQTFIGNLKQELNFK